jgi:hypothetical protein
MNLLLSPMKLLTDRQRPRTSSVRGILPTSFLYWRTVQRARTGSNSQPCDPKSRTMRLNRRSFDQQRKEVRIFSVSCGSNAPTAFGYLAGKAGHCVFGEWTGSASSGSVLASCPLVDFGVTHSPRYYRHQRSPKAATLSPDAH